MKSEVVKSSEERISLKEFLSSYGIYLAFVIIVAILSLSNESFFTVRNGLNVLRQVSINGILAIGVTFVIITGGIDLSLGSILALAGVVATSFAHPDQYPLIVPIILGIIVGGICGLVNGSLVAYSKVTPFIVTLGLMTIARGAALIYSNGRPIIDLSNEFQYIGQGDLIGVPVPIFIYLFIILLGYIILHKSKFGRYIFATGGNEMAAIVSGLNVQKVKLLVYTFSGLCCGLGGIILAARTNCGAPNAGDGYELDAIAASVIGGTSLSGGRGSVIGAVIGTLIIGVINNGLDILNVSSYIQLIVKGAIIIGAVWLDQVNSK